MFRFSDSFNVLSGDLVTLKLCSKTPEDGEQLPFYYYDIFENKSNHHVGKISVRIGSNYHSYYNGNIGYEVDEPFRGNHYSYHALLLVLQVAKAHGMDSLYITCNASNTASKKIIERTGAALVETAKIPEDYIHWKEGIEDHCIYKLEMR